jgi:hypothetical protein
MPCSYYLDVDVDDLVKISKQIFETNKEHIKCKMVVNYNILMKVFINHNIHYLIQKDDYKEEYKKDKIALINKWFHWCNTHEFTKIENYDCQAHNYYIKLDFNNYTNVHQENPIYIRIFNEIIELKKIIKYIVMYNISYFIRDIIYRYY